MTTPGEALLDAALAPLDATLDGHTDTVSARVYTHPALGDRTVVRLVPDALAPAEDSAMDFLGFAGDGHSEPLALTRPRGLGYPEWALIHDPGRRAQALALVRPMEKAARLAATRPGPASDEFARIAAEVPISHLPAYWEQAGRAFLAAGNARTAAIMFGRAREAEQVYSLPVDEATRRESFLEFAFAGALTVKALTAHAAELSGRYASERAYTEFRELAVRRTLGGLPPWTGLLKQMRSLAKAAGIDQAEQERDLLRELLAVPATSSAPEGFWKSARTTLVAVGRDDVEVARALLGMFVDSGGYDDTGFHAWWLELLSDAGSVDLLADPAQTVPGGAAGWLSRMISHTRGWRWSLPAGFLDLTARIADRLRADGTPVDLTRSSGYRAQDIPADLLDLCLELGVPVTADSARRRLDLDTWVDHPRGGPRRDLRFLRADPAWEPLVGEAVASYSGGYRAGPGGRRVLEDLLPYEYLHAYVERRLDILTGALGGGLLQAREGLESLRNECDGGVFRVFPGHLDRLASLDVADLLATTLNAGIIDEYSWPALEEAARELGAHGSGGAKPAGTASWPVFTLTSHERAIAVGPGGRVAEHTLNLPKGADDPIAFYVQGRFLVAYSQDHEQRGYWSDAPGERLSFDYSSVVYSGRWHNGTPGVPQLTADGARMNGERALRAGDADGARDRHVLSDGTTYWTDPGTRDGLVEVDPDTGDRGRASLPAFLEELPLGSGERLLTRVSTLAPLAEPVSGGPLGDAAGASGFAVVAGNGAYRVVATDGRELVVRPADRNRHRFPVPVGLFTPPGGELRALADDKGVTLLDDEGRRVWSCHTGGACDCTAKWGTPYLTPMQFWYFMGPRDTRASARLRSVRGADLKDLVAAAIAERDRTTPAARAMIVAPVPITAADGPLAGTRGAAAALLADGEDVTPAPGVVEGVMGLAVSASWLRRDLDEYLEAIHKVRDAVDSGPEPEPLLTALTRFLPQRATGDGDVRGHIEATSRFLRGTGGTELLSARPRTTVDWSGLPGSVGLLAWSAASPLTGEEERAALVDFLARWAGTVFADPAVELDLGSVVSAKGQDPTAVGADGGRRAGLGLVPDLSGRPGSEDEKRSQWFAEVRTGDPLPLPAGLREVHRTRVVPGWGTTAAITAFLAALAEHGPLTWGEEAVAVVSERTGLPPEAATLLLHQRFGGNGLPADQRKAMGLTEAQVSIGGEELAVGHRDRDLWLALYRDALPVTGEIADLWSPAGARAAAERLADAWNRLRGARSPLPRTVLEALNAPWRPAGPSTVRLLADPAGHPALTEDASSHLEVGERYGRLDVTLRYGSERTAGLHELLGEFAVLIPWAYAELPAGDPVRESVPALLKAVRARLEAPELLLGAFTAWGDDHGKLLERIGGEPCEVPGKAGASAEARDNGTVVAVQSSYSLHLYFRPARFDDGVHARTLRALLDSGEYPVYGHTQPRLVDLLRSPGYTAIAERIAAGALPAGAREYDPAASVPELLAEAAGTLGLSDDAARLYLQLLAVLEPTDKKVRTLNGWTPARHRKVQAELLEHGLVMTAKRSRAGRTVFLPGAWTDIKQGPDLPFETWKAPLYGLSRSGGGALRPVPDRHLPTRPIPEIFAEAWRRTREGDAPAL
ncbi:hypothetical protein [Nocardiopsis sp. CC223A]|uniref:hypothetical protein n=1 Tax=Nocardiopsis sp. CC223A TaxID=3044051 RepID=UPI00278BCEF6|nr:hypothetical protein [Nocardiopsis sp. CC223A]